MPSNSLNATKTVSLQRMQFWLLLAVFNLVFFGGCGDGRIGRVPVSGVVTIDGEPVPFGSIMFVPSDGSRNGGGSLDSEGRFRVSTFTAYDGLPPGTYEVSVAAIEDISQTKQRWHAPQKYADVATSGLSYEVKAKTDEVSIELTWKEDDKHSKPYVETLR